MSDALTDIARDQERASAYERYLGAICDWLQDPTDDKLALIVTHAEDCDSVRRGYWTGKTNLADRARESARRPKDGDIREWSRLLTPIVAQSEHNYPGLERRLYKLSPFAGRRLVVVHQGYGFADYKGDIGRIFKPIMEKALDDLNAIRAEKNIKPSDAAGDYLVALDDRLDSMTAVNVR